MISNRAFRSGGRGFTLIELLVVMGILVVLAVLTGIGVSQVSREARLSSGVNQVIAALGTARSYAIQNNRTAMLVFTVNVDRENLGRGEIVELVLARATRELTNNNNSFSSFAERYVPVPGLPAVQLPRGIKVAGPMNTLFEGNGGPSNEEGIWLTQPGGDWGIAVDGVTTAEPGHMIGVMFGPDGTMITRNPLGAGGSGTTIWPYLDADRDRGEPDVVGAGGSWGGWRYVNYDVVGDEPNLIPVQWLAVFDDEALRRAIDTSAWSQSNDIDSKWNQWTSDVSRWVDQFGVPVFFNRYTGVAEVLAP